MGFLYKEITLLLNILTCIYKGGQGSFYFEMAAPDLKEGLNCIQSTSRASAMTTVTSYAGWVRKGRDHFTSYFSVRFCIENDILFRSSRVSFRSCFSFLICSTRFLLSRSHCHFFKVFRRVTTTLIRSNCSSLFFVRLLCNVNICSLAASHLSSTTLWRSPKFTRNVLAASMTLFSFRCVFCVMFRNQTFSTSSALKTMVR